MSETCVPASFATRGGWWVVAQFILMFSVVLLGVVAHGDWTRLYVIVPGGGLFCLGGYFGIAGVIALGENRTPFPQPRPNSRLVQSGIYGRVRHPLYTSVMLVSIGWSLIWQSLWSFLVAVLLIPFLNAKARREERALRKTFYGYSDYANAVPRFLPHWKPHRQISCDFKPQPGSMQKDNHEM